MGSLTVWVMTLILSLGMSFAATPKRSVVVDISAQKIYCYENGKLLKTSRISTGYKRKSGPKDKRGSETPRGTFTVKEKYRIVYSQKYNNAPMPYAMRFNGQIWFHACQSGEVYRLGRKASHGCVRMHPKFAPWLFKWLQTGDTVKVRT